MTRLMFKKHAAEFFAREFPGFQWAGLAGAGHEDFNPAYVVHRFENAKTGQRMLIEVFVDNSWAAYTFHANGEGKT